MKTGVRILLIYIFSFILWLCFCGFAVTLPRTDHTLTVFIEGYTYTFTYPEIDTYNGELYIKSLDDAIERMRADTSVLPVDAEIIFTPNETELFKIKRERYGKQIDTADLKNKIQYALKSRKREIYATFYSLHPSITAKELSECTHKKGEFFTDYSASSDGRKHNISLAASLINGSVIQSRQTFSFNQTVGERTYERGFTDAKVISRGTFTDGVGGGVCQASTTLYNAALLSELTVCERHRHSIAVNYVKPSFDAMVTDNVCDLKIKNNTPLPVFIKATADGSTLRFEFYGIKNKYDVKLISTEIKRTEIEPEIIEDDTLKEDEEIIITPSHDYIKSTAHAEYYQNGVLVKTLPLSTDIYSGVKGKKAIKKLPTDLNSGESEIIKRIKEDIERI